MVINVGEREQVFRRCRVLMLQDKSSRDLLDSNVSILNVTESFQCMTKSTTKKKIVKVVDLILCVFYMMHVRSIL